MDYPFVRSNLYDVSNNVWLLPVDYNQINQKQKQFDEKNKQEHFQATQLGNVVDYLDHIPNTSKFNYVIVVLVIILLVYRLGLSSSIWIGLIVGIFVVYYLNERSVKEVGQRSDQLIDVLQSDLLKNTRYFTSNVQLIDWINSVGELKKINVIVFNNMIKSLETLLRLTQEIKLGLRDPKQTLEIVQDLKTLSLNQFQSLIQTMPAVPQIRNHYNQSLKRLSKILNDHFSELNQKINQYYENRPINTNSLMATYRPDDPKPDDPNYNPNYNFYN